MTNLPPGVSISDKDAPWNDPGVDAYFPMSCERCGFTATDPSEMGAHEHGNDNFTR